MELFKKVCRLCYKDFQTKAKQQRYCGKICSYKGKNRKAFNHYLGDKNKMIDKVSADSMQIQRWRPDNDMAGLCLDRESYQE